MFFGIITFAPDIRIFSCLFVKFVLYMGRFLGEGTCFLFAFSRLRPGKNSLFYKNSNLK